MIINIILCCGCHHYESNINWAEWITAISTAALAFLTVFLAIAAIGQLKDIKRFIVENIIIKQIEFHYKLFEGINSTFNVGDPFKMMYQAFSENYDRRTGQFSNDEDGTIKQIKAAFADLYNSYGNKFGAYYKNLYYLIQYINDLPADENYKKDYYIKLVTAQLSKFELLLLAYDCIWIQDQPKGKNFIEYASKLNLLYELETDQLLLQSHEDLLINRYKIKFRN